MAKKVYFCADRITVSADHIAIGRRTFPITAVSSARCERVKWLWPLPIYLFALVLTLSGGLTIRPVRRRNAYFVFQLVNAVHAAIEESQQQAAPLAGNSSA